MYFEKSFIANRENLRLMNEWVDHTASACKSVSLIEKANVLIGVGEVLQNCIRHGFEAHNASGTVKITVSDLTIGLAVTVTDDAPVSNPTQWHANKDVSEGGHGLNIIANSSSGYSFFSSGDENKAFLCFLDERMGLTKHESLFVAKLIESRIVSLKLTDLVSTVKSQLPQNELAVLFDCSLKIEALEERAEFVPAYHNAEHFREVFISCLYLIDLGKVDDQWRMAFLLAALLHDYKHPGISAMKYVDGYSSIEARSMALIINDFPQLCSDEILLSQLEVLILGTEDQTVNKLQTADLTDSTELQMQHLFNACDIASSIIPFLGLANTKKIIIEGALRDEPEALFNNFQSTLAKRINGTPFEATYKNFIY